MTSYTITMTGPELTEVIFALRCTAAESRSLANCCGDMNSLAKEKAKFQDQAKRCDELANRINLSPIDQSALAPNGSP